MTAFFMAVFFLGNGQNITGTVTSDNGLPIVNVQLIINNTTVTTTNREGSYTLDSPYQLPLSINYLHPDFQLHTEILTKNKQTIILKNKVEFTNDLDPVVLSASFQKESGVLIPKTAVNQTQLNQFSPVSLVPAINQTPGVYIQSGAINTNRITIRGVGSRTLFGTNKIRAYFNGIPITNGAGETSIDTYNANTIASLEIIKGPKATQYGSNLGGTLLLSTKKSETDGFTMDNYFTVGSYGLFKHTTNLSIEDEDLSVHYSYDHLQLNGYRDNNGYNRNSHLLTIDSTLNERFSVGLIFQHFNTFAQIASSISQENFEEDPTQAAFTWGQAKGYEDNRTLLLGTSITSTISNTWSNTTSLYYTYLDKYEPRPFNILDEKTNGYGARSIFAKKYVVNNKSAVLSVGAEWNEDQYHWDTIENLYETTNGNGSFEGQQLNDNNEKRSSFNAFATTTFSITSQLKAEVGLNVNSTNYTYKDNFNSGSLDKSASRDFDPIFAPNFNLKYEFLKNLNFFGNVSRGFNYPGIEETLTPDGTINPEIGPEKGWNYEVGSDANFFNNSLKLRAGVYLLSITDLLVAERVGDDQFIGRNAGKTEHKGIELSTNYATNVSAKLVVTGYINAEFNDHKFIDFVDGDNDFSGNELTGVPKEKISAGITLSHDVGIYALTNYQYIGSQAITDANSLYSSPYRLVNFQAGIKRDIYNFLKIELLGGINNVANEKYASSILINASSFGGNSPRYFYPGNPRNYYSSLRVTYNF